MLLIINESILYINGSGKFKSLFYSRYQVTQLISFWTLLKELDEVDLQEKNKLLEKIAIKIDKVRKKIKQKVEPLI